MACARPRLSSTCLKPVTVSPLSRATRTGTAAARRVEKRKGDISGELLTASPLPPMASHSMGPGVVSHGKGRGGGGEGGIDAIQWGRDFSHTEILPLFVLHA